LFSGYLTSHCWLMEWASFEQSGPSPVKRREQRSIQSNEEMKLPESNY